jgi:high-affinity iron transporter
MLAWHAIWMAGHGRNLAAEVRVSSQAVREGRRTLFAILLVVAIAVLREGAETILFVSGIALSGASSVNAMLAGALLGAAAGALVGWTLYRGLLRIPLRWFFAATSALVLLLAAGMAAQAARYLIQADLLPSLKSPLWDLSGLLSNESALGTLLHGLIGYDAHPAGTQVLFYVAVAAAIGAGMKWSQSAKPGNPNKAMAL